MNSSDTSLQKLPPQHLEAERSVLASVMLDEDAIAKVLEILKEDDFYQEAHRKIFHHMLNLFEANEVIDVVTLGDELRKNGQLEEAGGTEYLLALLESIPTTANVVSHAKIVKEKSTLRKMINTATRIVGESYQETEDVDLLLDRAEQLIFEISEDKARDGFTCLKDLIHDSFKTVEDIYEKKGPLIGLPTGFDRLDELTCGLHNSDLVIVAARPSMGKTSFALNIAVHGAVHSELPVAIFSLETSKEQLVLRMLCSEARVDSHKLRSGYLSESDWPKLTKAAARLSELSVYIDDTPGMSVMEMRAKTRRLKKEHGLSLIIVDYLQLMQGRGRENRQQEISEISRSLKGLAREMDVPLIALSQLNRAVDSRHPPRPVLSDLRESGAIEQDADLITFIYRPEMYKKGTDDDAEIEEGIAEIIIGKQRNGPVGTVKLAFNKNSTRFENLAAESTPF